MQYTTQLIPVSAGRIHYVAVSSKVATQFKNCKKFPVASLVDTVLVPIVGTGNSSQICLPFFSTPPRRSAQTRGSASRHSTESSSSSPATAGFSQQQRPSHTVTLRPRCPSDQRHHEKAIEVAGLRLANERQTNPSCALPSS